ncbi:extracellular solute-binding protein [Cellulosilyticum sp. I15G10I2]|uniref:extracellular solute-binding protein n=1 Tax=Cellulosilyticum sp. I15G10I2 TaxID=1892843 RepID=UPI00085C9EFB|nr:extracellular solute-binding protein [Cellulosilyticum sp. I15G10I2]
MKKTVMKLLSVLLLGTMMASSAGCAQSESTSSSGDASNQTVSEKATDEKPASEPIKLTVWHQSVAETDPASKLIKDAIAEWNAANPNVIVEEDGVTGEQYKTKIKTAIAANEGPDLSYMWGGSFVEPYVKAGNMLAIDEYLTDDIKSKLVPGTINGCVFDGKTYSLPSTTFIASLYCNTELFEKAGAKIPTTYNELLEAVAKLKAANITPIVLGEKDRWPGMYWFDIIAMRQAGNEASMAAMKDPAKFDSPEFVEAARKMQELVDAGAFNDSMFSMSYDEMIGAFTQGKGAMLFQANWVNAAIEDPSAATSGKVVAVPFPIFEDGAGNVTEFYGGGVDGYYINANTKHPKEAAEFLIYLSEKMDQGTYLANSGLPCWDTTGLDTSSLIPLTKQAAELMSTATSFIKWWDNILPAESSEVHKDLIAQLLAKKITPEVFSQEMAKVKGAQ